MRAAPSDRCPSCGEAVLISAVRKRRACPQCGRRLRIAYRYEGTAWILSLVYGLLIARTLGLESVLLLYGTLAFSVLVRTITLVVAPKVFLARLVPANIKGAPSIQERPKVAASGHEPDAPVPSPAIDLTPPPDPWTIQGVMVGVLIAAITVVWLFALTSPVIYWMFPEFRATKAGPPGFPVTVHIGQKELSLTNGLSSALRCEVDLGGRAVFTTMMGIGAGQTASVSYTKLGPYEREVRGAARDHISLECVEPSGRRHSITFY